MTIDATDSGTWLLIIIMMVVTIVTRWGGVFVMSYIPINYRVKQFIEAMSGAVLIAIIAPMMITEDLGGKSALIVTAFVTLTMKKPLFAILAGMLTAAVSRGI